MVNSGSFSQYLTESGSALFRQFLDGNKIITNDTRSPMCDGQSLTFVVPNYNSFGFTDMGL